MNVPPLGVVEMSSEKQAPGYGNRAPIDRMYDLLKHPERRAVVEVMAETNPIHFDDLAVRIASDGTGAERQRARIALHHHHLPRFEAAAVLAYDQRSGDIAFEPGPEKHQIIRLLQDIS